MGEAMWLVHVEKHPRLLTVAEAFRLFRDADNALAYAKQHGYDSMMPLNDNVGSRNVYSCGDVSVSIIRVLVAD